LSDDAQLIAGLSDEWQVGIWDRRHGVLLNVLDVPQLDFCHFWSSFGERR
jgi:hypothetical protein